MCNTFNIPLPVDTRLYDAVQTTDEPTGMEEQQEIPTEPDEPTGAEEQQENAIEPNDPAGEQQENTTEPDEPTSTKEQQENAIELYKKLIDGTHTAEEVKSEHILHKIAEKLESKRSCMQNQLPAVLWIQYMHMVDILRTFIRAERTGNWKLHLQVVHDMLPYFAAVGHNPYAKTAYLYLQSMYDLQKEHQDVYTSSQDGLHVV